MPRQKNNNTNKKDNKKTQLQKTKEPNFTQVFSGIHVAQFLVFYIVFADHCFSVCPFSCGHDIVLSFTASDYPLSIFKLFLIAPPPYSNIIRS
jgi:hypothetical protein